jgi:hypothetical protein
MPQRGSQAFVTASRHEGVPGSAYVATHALSPIAVPKIFVTVLLAPDRPSGGGDGHELATWRPGICRWGSRGEATQAHDFDATGGLFADVPALETQGAGHAPRIEARYEGQSDLERCSG